LKNSLSEYLEQLHERLKPLRDGRLADYIPELAQVNPDLFGIALVTVEGHVHQVGDSLHNFSIQSVSKPFTYGIALEDKGTDLVRRKIDVEPSGEAFNSISLEEHSGRPMNPMINAGAMVATDLVDGDSGDEKFARILESYCRYAARELHMDAQVYLSEKTTGHRNRAISHLLRNYEILSGEPEQPLDAYFRQCSILVTAQDLAVMGATLANKGVNPVTNVRALRAEHVPAVLAVMSSCGMYDYSGNWISSVGLPSKSGVGGGIVAVLPGQFGLAVYSPRLDAKGNSVRGIRVCEMLSRDYSLHMLDTARMTTSNTVRAVYTAAQVRSRFERSPAENRLLADIGDRVLVCELTGEQSLVTSEALSSDLLQRMTDRECLILDFKRMTGVDDASSRVFEDLARELRRHGKSILISGIRDKFGFRKRLGEALSASGQQNGFELADLDQAIQFSEERLLEAHFDAPSEARALTLAEHPVCRGLDQAELDWLTPFLDTRLFQRGEYLCRAGEPARSLYIIMRGKVDVLLHRPARGGTYKVASYCGGAVLGETACFEQSVRAADIVAVSEVEACLLQPPRLAAQTDELALRTQLRLYRNLAEIGFSRLKSVNTMLLTLTR